MARSRRAVPGSAPQPTITFKILEANLLNWGLDPEIVAATLKNGRGFYATLPIAHTPALTPEQRQNIVGAVGDHFTNVRWELIDGAREKFAVSMRTVQNGVEYVALQTRLRQIAEASRQLMELLDDFTSKQVAQAKRYLKMRKQVEPPLRLAKLLIALRSRAPRYSPS